MSGSIMTTSEYKAVSAASYRKSISVISPTNYARTMPAPYQAGARHFRAGAAQARRSSGSPPPPFRLGSQALSRRLRRCEGAIAGDYIIVALAWRRQHELSRCRSAGSRRSRESDDAFAFLHDVVLGHLSPFSWPCLYRQRCGMPAALARFDAAPFSSSMPLH